MDPRGNRVSSATIHKDDAPDGVCTLHTEENVVKVCLDCPILDEKGAETGLYHIAGPFCPEESLQEICLPGYEREPIGSAVSLDEKYRLDYYQSLEVCTVHTEETVIPDPLDPNAPMDPNAPLDPNNPGGTDFPLFPWFPDSGEESDENPSGESTLPEDEGPPPWLGIG